MLENHKQLLIVHVCIRNGNGTDSINGAMPSGKGGTEQNIINFLTCIREDLNFQNISIILVKGVHQ